MIIIELEGLEPAYRLYQTDSGMYVRVRVDMADQSLVGSDRRLFTLVLEEADAEGNGLGSQMPGYTITEKLNETDLQNYNEDTVLPENIEEGALCVVAGYLYEGVSGIWQERGPVPLGAAAGLVEVLALLDRTARPLVSEAERVFMRRRADGELAAHLGTIF